MSETRPLHVPSPDATACIHCKAWRAWGSQAVCLDGERSIKDQPLGQCRVRAPAIVTDTLSAQTAVWPVVAADDWCLEFSRRR